MKTTIISLTILGLCGFGSLSAEKVTENKNVTIIHGESTADGKSQVAERLLEECIATLPNVATLDPIVSSASEYLKEINGDPSKNDFVKTYTASLEINYVVQQKVLIVVTTNSVQGQEPVMKVMDKTLQRSKKFVSNSADGDLYAGRSRRKYYFSTPEGASADVKKRASAWIKQQSAVICKK
jgi:hypothetical protein